jgi:ribonuclease BN (tRNA processing enzyme)
MAGGHIISIRHQREARMEITVLGSGTAIPDKERGSPGISVRSGDTLLLLDLGSGSLYRAARFGIEVRRVDGVLLSHLHPDHTGDLVPLLFAFRNPEWPREGPLSIFGPTGLLEFLKGLEATYGSWVAAEGYQREEKVLPSGPFPLKDVLVSSCPVRHGPATVAYEIKDAVESVSSIQEIRNIAMNLQDSRRMRIFSFWNVPFPRGRNDPDT